MKKENYPLKNIVIKYKDIITTSISLIPQIGGTLSLIIDKHIPESKFKRIKNFIDDFELTMQSYADTVQKSILETEEFAYIFEKVLIGVSTSIQEIKLRCYKNILVNSVINPDLPSFDEKEIYLKLVEDLTSNHLILLLEFSRNQLNGVVMGQQQILEDIKEISPNHISIIIKDLENRGLISTIKVHHLSTGSKVPKEVNEMSIEDCVSHSLRVNQISTSFIKFVLES